MNCFHCNNAFTAKMFSALDFVFRTVPDDLPGKKTVILLCASFCHYFILSYFGYDVYLYRKISDDLQIRDKMLASAPKNIRTTRESSFVLRPSVNSQ